MALSTSAVARWTILSSSTSTPSGRSFPRSPALAMYALRTACAAYGLRPVRFALICLQKIFEFPPHPLLVLLPPRPVDPRNRLSLQSIIGGSQALHLINMVQQCHEPLSLLPPRCLTYPLKRAGHVLPALGPVHVTLGHLPLGQSPSLHRLLDRLRLGLVRQLRWYYGTV